MNIVGKDTYATTKFASSHILIVNNTYERNSDGSIIKDADGNPLRYTDYKLCNRSSFYLYDYYTGNVNAFRGDYYFAASLMSITKVDKPNVYFLTGHGEPVGDASDETLTSYGNALALYYLFEEAGCNIRKIDLQYDNFEPNEKNAIVVVYGPKRDITSSSTTVGVNETDKLAAFLEGEGNSMMFFMDSKSVQLTNFEAFLKEHCGVTLADTVVKDSGESSVSHDGYSVVGKYQTDKNGNVVAAADPPNAEKTGAWANTWSSLKSNMFGAGDYVGFRVERGVNCTESISNQTGPTGVAQKMNSYAQQQREKYENYGNSWVAKTLGDLAKGPSDALKSAMTDLTAMLGEKLGLGDIGAVLTQGNGFLDMPDVWKGSSFSRSYSFNIQLRARYGDPVSIFQSVYIPLIMLLAAAMPRSVGDSMYTSPFLIKAYCKGMFAVPCGIIESMSISRGKDEFGWSHDHLPTSIDVNLQIKDLTPTFFLSMQDIGLFDTFSRNDNMMEYLDTLSALGITERLYMWPKVMRKMTAAFLTKRNTIFNSNYWGMRLGRNNVARLIAAVTPFANHEKSDWQYGNVTGSIFNGSDARTAGNKYVQN